LKVLLTPAALKVEGSLKNSSCKVGRGTNAGNLGICALASYGNSSR